MLVKDKYSKAYVEILEIIKCMGKEYENKIPRKLLSLFEENKDNNYEYHIDYKKELKEQNISEEALGILSIIELKYWATPEQREYLEKVLKENEQNYQCELREKYNPDKIFENKDTLKENDKNNNLAIVEYKSNLFTKLIAIIKRILNKK